MGEPKESTFHKENKKKVAINLTGGGGPVAGIIIIGGALATAALVSALTVGRRLRKSGNNNNNQNHCQSTESEKFIRENVSINDKDESKGVLFFSTDSSADMNQKLSNGEAIDNSGISSKSFFQEEKQGLELYSGNGDLICDDKEIVYSNGLHGSDNSMLCNGSIVKKEEFSLPVSQEQMLFQPANMNDEPRDGEIETVEKESKFQIPDGDRNTGEDRRLLQVNNDQKITEVKCIEEAESALIIRQPSEENEGISVDHDDQDNEKLKINSQEGSRTIEKVETLPGPEAENATKVDKDDGHSKILMVEENDKTGDEREVTAYQLEGGETVDAASGDQAKVNGEILMFETEEKVCNQHDGSMIVQTVEILKRDERFEADHEDEGDNVLLIVPSLEVLKRDDKLETDEVNGVYGWTVILSGEEEAEKFVQNDGLVAVDKGLDPAEQGKDETEIPKVAEEIGGPAPGDNEKEADEFVSVSSFNPQKQLTEKQEQEQENPPIHSQEVTGENGVAQEPNLSLEAQDELKSGWQSNLDEIEELVEATEKKEENVSGQLPRKESEDRITEGNIDPQKQSIDKILKENEELTATTELDSVAITGQMEMSKEDDETDEAKITNKGDSSVEYNAEPIWPAESLEELLSIEQKLDDQKGEQQAEENKALRTEEKVELHNIKDQGLSAESHQNINEGKDKNELTFLEKYTLELVEHKNQGTNLLKLRTVDLSWIIMVLLWPFCFWHFGLPLLKISLIVILVILLSKIQGT